MNCQKDAEAEVERNEVDEKRVAKVKRRQKAPEEETKRSEDDGGRGKSLYISFHFWNN